MAFMPHDGRAADRVVHLVTLGDSITRGQREGVKAEETFAALLGQGLSTKRRQVQVTNVGIGGEQTDQGLARLDKILALRPQIVTIMYGTCDSHVDPGKETSRLTVDQYRANLEELIKRLRAAKVEPVLMTPPAWGAKAKDGLGENPNGRLAPFVEACREVAKTEKVPLVDHNALWSEKQAGGFDIGTWTTDQCHPNVAGHRIMAETIAPVLKEVRSLK
jgi:lysophospholipase L1-like esterase